MHQDVIYDFAANLTRIGDRPVRNYANQVDCSTWYAVVTRQMWTLRCFTPASIDARWAELSGRSGRGQPARTDAERYMCACLHCTQGLAGRGDWYQCGLDWGFLVTYEFLTADPRRRSNGAFSPSSSITSQRKDLVQNKRATSLQHRTVTFVNVF